MTINRITLLWSSIDNNFNSYKNIPINYYFYKLKFFFLRVDSVSMSPLTRRQWPSQRRRNLDATGLRLKRNDEGMGQYIIFIWEKIGL